MEASQGAVTISFLGGCQTTFKDYNVCTFNPSSFSGFFLKATSDQHALHKMGKRKNKELSGGQKTCVKRICLCFLSLSEGLVQDVMVDF